MAALYLGIFVQVRLYLNKTADQKKSANRRAYEEQGQKRTKHLYGKFCLAVKPVYHGAKERRRAPCRDKRKQRYEKISEEYDSRCERDGGIRGDDKHALIAILRQKRHEKTPSA